MLAIDCILKQHADINNGGQLGKNKPYSNSLCSVGCRRLFQSPRAVSLLFVNPKQRTDLAAPWQCFLYDNLFPTSGKEAMDVRKNLMPIDASCGKTKQPRVVMYSRKCLAFWSCKYQVIKAKFVSVEGVVPCSWRHQTLYCAVQNQPESTDPY